MIASRIILKRLNVESDWVEEDKIAMSRVTLLVRLSNRVGSLFQDAASVASDLFTDSHAISRLTDDVNVNDLDRVDESTYQDEASNGL